MTSRETDLSDIRNLLARYSQSFDLADAAGTAALFTADGVLDTTAPAPDAAGVFTGHDEIGEHVAATGVYSVGRLRTSPAQSVVQLRGDSATVRSYAIVTRDYGPPEIPGDLTHSELLTTGIFFDELRRDAGVWKFSRRVFRHDAHPDVLALVGRPIVTEPTA